MSILMNTGEPALYFALTQAQKLSFAFVHQDNWTSDGSLDDLQSLGVVILDGTRSSGESHERLIQSDDTLVSLSRNRRTISAVVYSKSHEASAAMLETIKAQLPPGERKSNFFDVTFWYHTMHGPRSYDRQLQAPAWKDIEGNYPPNTRARLALLQAAQPTESSGKLILWQGEPGTGKTFALRALAEEWASWCRVHYVLDPERFFAEGDYLLSVILGNDEIPQAVGAADSRPPWRLVVLEDAGEMLAKDAKIQVGQGLARLLNLCDGLLGQGLRVLVLITTNEQVGSLHAAVSRPGRCLSQINFERFDAASAHKWLEAHGSSITLTKQAALADLYAIASGNDVATRPAVGFG